MTFKLKLRVSILALLLLALTFIACRKDEEIKNSAVDERGQIVSVTLFRSLSKLQVDSTLASINPLAPLLFPTQNGVKIYHVVYKTLDAKGTNTICSGAIVIPDNVSGKSFPLFSYQHGTTTQRFDVPSRGSAELNIGIIAGATGYIACLTDYVGLGDSPGFHPYVHAKSEATAVVDILRATRNYCRQNGINLNGQVFLAGYSQGGHATMAAHRELEQNHANEFTVTASAPLSGPYDISGVQARILTIDSAYSVPAFLPYVVLGYQQAYGNLYNTLSDIFISPYDTLIPRLFNGTYPANYVNDHFPKIPKQMVRPDVFEAFSTNPNHPIRLALKDNDVYDWKPKAPIHMCYCEADEQVTFANAIMAYNWMRNKKGATNVEKKMLGKDLNHAGCVFPALSYTKSWFDSLKK
ncbi:MAG: lipase family protein [Bacteroidia bacterium]|nr:lipase family protein [Bacteroidia bacterium]MDW8159556.1 lipase family protein [Bacteroidia bacterium]